MILMPCIALLLFALAALEPLALLFLWLITLHF